MHSVKTFKKKKNLKSLGFVYVFHYGLCALKVLALLVIVCLLLLYQYGADERRESPDIQTLLRRFWKVAAPYWSSEDKVQARLRLAAVFTLTLGTTGISVGFNFLGRDFYNALASESLSLSLTNFNIMSC